MPKTRYVVIGVVYQNDAPDWGLYAVVATSKRAAIELAAKGGCVRGTCRAYTPEEWGRTLYDLYNGVPNFREG